MAAQLNYTYSTPKGVPGGKYDISYDEVVTRTNEEEDGKMLYGLVVAAGASAGNTVKLPTAATTADQIEGVALHAANTEQDMNGKVVVKKNSSLGIMKKGNIWGRIAEGATVKYGAPAYVVIDASIGQVGSFIGAETESKTLDIGATFGNATDDGIAVIVLK